MSGRSTRSAAKKIKNAVIAIKTARPAENRRVHDRTDTLFPCVFVPLCLCEKYLILCIRPVNYILSGLVFLIPADVINHSSGTLNHAQPAYSSRSL